VRQGKLDPFNRLIQRAVDAANRDDGFRAISLPACRRLVLTRDRLDETVLVSPATMEDRFFIEWDKDDLDAMGLMKVDVPALGMLTCIRKAST
jgi:error-prone DNA polymerase